MATIKANPFKPDKSVDTSIVLDITTYTDDPLLATEGGGYYIKRHMRVPMKEKDSSKNRHVAIFPKTIASQVLETTEKAFVAKSEQVVLSKLTIVEVEGDDKTKHIKITDGNSEDIVPSTYDIARLNEGLDGLANGQSLLSNSLADQGTRIGTLEEFFDAAAVADGIINKWHEIEHFLKDITEAETLTGLIENTIANLIAGDNTWTGSNTFKKDLSAKNFVTTNGCVQIKQSSDFSTKYEHGQISRLNDSSGFNTTLIIPTADNKSITGTIAIWEEIPYIGFDAPSTPKAGDVWFSA